ncbi:unnamed protein product [Ilex paraguariensis]
MLCTNKLKLRMCEELFSFLLAGISPVVVICGGVLLGVLLIHFHPLVLSTCGQVGYLFTVLPSASVTYFFVLDLDL